MNIFGHRGAKGLVMENSLHGFLFAVNQGIDRFELDVRLSGDNQLMVVHDEKLQRLANSPLNVSKSRACVLSKIRLKGTQQGIPTLEQVVAACPSVVHWQFEIKTQFSNPKFIRPMQRLLDKYQLHDRATITSLHMDTLKTFSRVLPHLKLGYVQAHPWQAGISIATKLHCHMLVLNKKIAHKEYIEKAQRRGLHVSVWTVNLTAEMLRLYDYQADSIISDFPNQAKDVLAHHLKAP
ncbi:MAG: glycerophosphodiester phosphodiesterase [Bermanella sp.]